MTRYTNVALKKRTYVEAGFNYREPEEESNEAGPSNSNDHEEATNPGSTVEEGDAPAAAPKRKRSRKKAKKSVEGGGEENTAEGAGAAGKEASADGAEGDTAEGKGPVKVKSASKAAQGKKKLMRLKQKLAKGKNTGKEARQSASEQRRLRRIDERNADTTCFACREKGHAARDCPKAIASDALESEGGRRKLGKQTVGICYRCGSRRHNLSKCREAVDPENPLPFSSCFVCSKQGHLASQCPENRSKGVYPNGGCCKLCQETTHLAKDCPMRKPEVIATTTLVGTGAEAGADEDDFHTFRRKNLELTKEEKAEERLKKQQALKVGAHSGVVKAFGRPIQKSQKVVTF